MTLIQEHRSEATQHIVVFVTSIGDFRAQLLAASLLIIVLAVARQWRHAAFALTATLGTAIANGILKTFFARARPEVLLEPLTTYSMPSGHSSAAFALFMTLGVLAGRGQPVRLRLTWMLVAGIPALAIALSRFTWAFTGPPIFSPACFWRFAFAPPAWRSFNARPLAGHVGARLVARRARHDRLAGYLRRSCPVAWRAALPVLIDRPDRAHTGRVRHFLNLAPCQCSFEALTTLFRDK